MKVSIGIPAFNAAKHLPETIASICAQKDIEWELVVVDDGSTDDTADIVESYALLDERIRLVKKANGGVCSARNAAFAVMTQTSQYVLFIDADDMLAPNALYEMATLLNANPDAVAVAGLSCYIDENSAPIPASCEYWCREPHLRLINILPPQHQTHFVLSYRCCIATTGAVLIRAEAARAVGKWDADTTPCEDWDMWLRLSCAGEFVFMDDVVLFYRRHSNNASSNTAKMSRAGAVVRRKSLQTAKDHPELYVRTLQANAIYHRDRLVRSGHETVKNARRLQVSNLVKSTVSMLNHVGQYMISETLYNLKYKNI